MKTMTKKMGAIVLALALCLSLCCTALAVSSPDTKGSITIDGYAGEEYTIYQIFNLTYNPADEENIPTNDTSYSYTVVSPWENFLTSEKYSDYFKLVKVGDDYYLDPGSKIFEEESDSAFMAVFAQDALAWAADPDNNVTATAGPTAATAKEGAEPDPETGLTEGTVTFSDLNLGYYVVSSTVGTICSLDSTEPDVTIKDKNTAPVVHKYLADSTDGEGFDSDNDGVDDRTEDNADNKDTIRYELVIDNVAHVKELVVHDYMDPEQLDMSTIDIESIYLYKSDTDTTGTDISDDVTYTTTTCGGEKCNMDGCTFEISIPTEILDGEDVTDTAYVKIIYNIMLNEDLEDFDDDVDKIDNHANVTFGASGIGVPDEVDTYSYGFKIYKYTGDIESGEDTPLQYAEFVLQNSEGKYAAFVLDQESGIYLFDSWQDEIVHTLVSDENGMIHLDGLNEGTYTLTETKAPDGYNMLENPVTVIIATVGDNFDSFTVNGSDTHQVNVVNNAGTELPGTGGIGTTIFYIIGGVLVAGAVVVLITRRRMTNNEG